MFVTREAVPSGSPDDGDRTLGKETDPDGILTPTSLTGGGGLQVTPGRHTVRSSCHVVTVHGGDYRPPTCRKRHGRSRRGRAEDAAARQKTPQRCRTVELRRAAGGKAEDKNFITKNFIEAEDNS